MRARSLSTRLLASVSILLLVFFGLTILALDYVFSDASLTWMRTRLEAQVDGLISACDEHPGGKLLPGEPLAEARFEHPGSGLYGQIARSDGEIFWRSPSMTGTGFNFHPKIARGKRAYREVRLSNGSDVLALSWNFEWEFSDHRKQDFVFSVAQDLGPYNRELQQFRQRLFVWFGGLMVLLLGSLAALFRWVLKPVRRVEREIEAIEAGRASELGGGYPRELAGITANMNALLRGERERLARYRNTLGNLAHSLKTPLAVIRSLTSAAALREISSAKQLQDQVGRMDEIVGYQLKRAAMSGGSGLGTAPIEVAGVLAALCTALQKVYADKGIAIHLHVDPAARYLGDEGDLMEIAGNLLDNACKWCRTQVSVTAQPLVTPGSRRDGLLLVFEDDGPGIAPDQREHVLKRGARLDERVSGQGIGLSVVQEIAQLSGGSLEIETSSLDGAKITVRLPAA